MFHSIIFDLAALGAAFYLLSPLLVRSTFRFSARCRPAKISLKDLPPVLAEVFRQRIPELESLGFELAGCFDCGCLASQTQSFVAYFCSRSSRDFANVSAVVSAKRTTTYLEFSTSFSNGQILDTNNNGVLPLSPANPENKVFRCPQIRDARTLLRMHHLFIDKHASRFWPQLEPRGEEIQRLVRVIQNYGPRHARLGYMQLSGDGESYRLTWKGAFLMTWCALWPVSVVRRWMYAQAMQSELRSLEERPATALQNA